MELEEIKFKEEFEDIHKYYNSKTIISNKDGWFDFYKKDHKKINVLKTF
jgi:hypothetical protein